MSCVGVPPGQIGDSLGTSHFLPQARQNCLSGTSGSLVPPAKFQARCFGRMSRDKNMSVVDRALKEFSDR